MLSDARESTNRVKTGVIEEFFSEIVLFLVKKGSYTTFNAVKIWKIRKTWSMTKQRSSEILGVKTEIFSEKNVVQKSWSGKKFSVPKLGARSPPMSLWRISLLKWHDSGIQ